MWQSEKLKEHTLISNYILLPHTFFVTLLFCFVGDYQINPSNVTGCFSRRYGGEGILKVMRSAGTE